MLNFLRPFENTGTATSPAFSDPDIYTFGLSTAGHSISPTFVDIDDDGDFDAFVGKPDGHTKFLVNSAGLLLINNASNDILTGTPLNIDTVTYASATGPVNVSLNINAQQNTGGAGLDTLTSIENLIGSPFNDNLTGNSTDNLLRGGDGNDVLRGWSGVDILLGESGDDNYYVENVGDIIFENSIGIDTINSSVSYVLSKNVENLVLTGVAAINGWGNELSNNILGNAANNLLDGGWGNDTINGGGGEDILKGRFGNDNYVVDNFNDVILEGPFLYHGMDSVSSSVNFSLPENVENLTLTGVLNINGTGNILANNITGNPAKNKLIGEAGNDTLDGGAGADTLIGGLGGDNYVVDNMGDIITENLREGNDKIYSSVSYTLPINVENLILTGELPIIGTGNNQPNSIIGNTVANQLNGGIANDILDGGGGDDTLNGGTGTDTMIGGSNNDTYIVDKIGDVVTEKPNEGTDTVSSSLTYLLPANVENLILTGTGVINGTGNGLVNVITGNNAPNQLNGGIGNDTLDGGLGTNKLTGGIGNDIFKFTTKGHVDQITDFNVIYDTIQLENSVFTALTPGILEASQFKIGTKAVDANDFIIYNKTTGALLYDVDGNGSIAATQIATIGLSLDLTNLDIVVI